MLPHLRLALLPQAGDVVQAAAVGALAVLLPVEGDGEAVYLLLHPAQHGEQGRVVLYAQLLPLQRHQRSCPVAVVLHHAQDGHVQPQGGHRLPGGVGVAQAAVDEQHVRQRGEFGVAVQIPGESPGQYLLHGGVVVGGRQRLDGELPVIPLQRLSVLKHHHAGHHVVAAGVGDVVALHSVGEPGQRRQCLQALQGTIGALEVGGNALHLLPGVPLRHLHQVGPLAPLGGVDDDLPPGVGGEQGGKGVAALPEEGHHDLPGQQGPA